MKTESMKSKILALAILLACGPLAAKPAAGSLDAAKIITLQFLPYVSDVGIGNFKIFSAIEHDGIVTVNAGEMINDQHQSCSVNLVKHSGTRYGWVVSAYACRLMPRIDQGQ